MHYWTLNNYNPAKREGKKAVTEIVIYLHIYIFLLLEDDELLRETSTYTMHLTNTFVHSNKLYLRILNYGFCCLLFYIYGLVLILL
jgi:hypothetical protein